MKKCIWRAICAVFMMGACLASPLAMAGEAALPGDVFTAIMLKTMNYDRNAGRQAKDKVVIGIVCFADDAAGRAFADTVKENVVKVQGSFTIKDKPVEGKVIVLEKVYDKAKLEEQLKQENVSALVVAVTDKTAFADILELTGKLQISSICHDPDCAQNGAGMGIVEKDNKPRMVVNMTTVKREGSDFSGNFLSMCEVVK
ncbi:MAG: DUF4154 domain-containing protein [Candidatus Omnitrophica bacterium]|nr:DUF4154 domain-containing protein [Candidatus Omnitrophota bacterium]